MKTREYDLWADGYGGSVHLLDDKDEYPVAGYSELLAEVYEMVRKSDAKKVFDAGFGTGILTRKLYADGYEIYGIDASEQMVEAGKECMPNAKLVVADFSFGMPLSFVNTEFDVIISTYAFHHIDHFEKANLITDMLRHLKDGGKIIIGDLAFESLQELKNFRAANKENWLYEDLYMVYSEVVKNFEHAEWKKISKCAGIVTITK